MVLSCKHSCIEKLSIVLFPPTTKKDKIIILMLNFKLSHNVCILKLLFAAYSLLVCCGYSLIAYLKKC